MQSKENVVKSLATLLFIGAVVGTAIGLIATFLGANLNIGLAMTTGAAAALIAGSVDRRLG